MKIKELNPSAREFKPIDLVLTIESKREVEALWLIFNAAPVAFANFLNDGTRTDYGIKDFSATEICQNQNRDRIWAFLEELLKQVS